MAAGLQNFQIILDSPDHTFSPGDIVAGRVIVELVKAKRIKGLKIRFKGRAEVHWSEPGGTGKDRKNTWYRNSEDYFRLEFYLLGGVSDSESVEIASGCHVFPFTFSLPHDIPSSFESFDGKVTYSMKATMDRPWKFDINTEISLKVQTPYDLNLIPAARLAIQDEETKTVCCFPCGRGAVSVIISMPMSGFAIGEAIETTLAINNKSSAPVTKIKLKLIQKVKFYAHTRTKRIVKIIQKAEKLGPFNKTDVIALGMQLSAAPASGFPHCRIIDIQYSIAVKAVIFGCHRSIERVYPILIGTRSTLNSHSMQNAHAIPLPTNALLHEAERLTTEKPPPSYDTCMKMEN